MRVTGPGLALSRQLVEAMGGSAGVTSNIGDGSVFCVELAAGIRVADGRCLRICSTG
jgi:signal transduction histidine kinase